MLINKVWTPSGLRPGVTSSLVGKGESIINYQDGVSTYVSEGKKGVDNQPSSVHPNDDNVIAGNDIDYIGYYRGKTSKPMSFADQVAPLSIAVLLINNSIKPIKNPQLSSLHKTTLDVLNRELNKATQPIMAKMKEITDRQELLHEMESDPQYGPLLANKGKDGLPKFKKGTDIPWFWRQMPAFSGLTASLGQLMHYKTQPVSYHSTYAGNPYEAAGLKELASLRQNPYAAIKASQDAERRAAFANAEGGGTTGSLKYLGRVALGIAGMQNAANVISASQQQNNAYRQQYANALLQEGNAQATRRQNAAQHDWSDYVAAHGRKTAGIEKATANMLNAINQGYANEFKYNTWRDSVEMYQQLLDDNQKALAADVAARAEERRLAAQRQNISKGGSGNYYNTPYLSNRFLFQTDPFWTNPRLTKH